MGFFTMWLSVEGKGYLVHPVSLPAALPKKPFPHTVFLGQQSRVFGVKGQGLGAGQMLDN